MGDVDESLETPASPDPGEEESDSFENTTNESLDGAGTLSKDDFHSTSSGSSPEAASSKFIPHKKFRRSSHSASVSHHSPRAAKKRKLSPASSSSSGSDDEKSKSDDVIAVPIKKRLISTTNDQQSTDINKSSSSVHSADVATKGSFTNYKRKIETLSSDSEPEDDDVKNEPVTTLLSFPRKKLATAAKLEYNPPESADKTGIGWKLMGKAGYQAGKGLGRAGQGRVEPVGLSTQRGRRGLGAEAPAGLEPDFELKWDRDKEIISVQEYPDWLPSCTADPPTKEEVSTWMKTGPKKVTIDDETEFCSEVCLGQVLKSKSVFDQLNDRDLRNARTRANPFETIKGAFFQNRAAMKTANVDAVFDWILTDPADPGEPEVDSGHRKPWVPENSSQLYYFADVCAGPGGFTEYLLWKKGWNAHGFGFTLKGKDDFKLDNFLAASPEMFEPFYGINGLEGDGDVMNPTNLHNFEQFVKKTTADGQGVHLYMADGGFSVEGQENIQEILSKRLYLCQFLCGLSILRPGGNFLCKLFDLFTPFSVGLVYLMYRIFDRVCIHKPNTSRPANSERYIVCKGMREKGWDIVRDYMRSINQKMDDLSKKPEADQAHADVVEIVPLDVIKDDADFFEYMQISNDKLAMRQATYLEKYRVFAQNPNLLDTRQDNLREECLKYWHIPDKLRAQPPRPSPAMGFRELCPHEGEKADWLHRRRARPFTSLEQLHIVNNYSGLDFRCFVATDDHVAIILALGKHFIFQYEGTSRWDMLQSHKFKLPRNTLIAAEMTHVYKGRGQGLQKTPILRIIDAHFLAGVDVSWLPYDSRMEKIRKFCSAIGKENSRTDLGWIRPAEHWKLIDLRKHKSRFGVGKILGAERLVFYDRIAKNLGDTVSNTVPYLACKGLYMQRIVRKPWLVCWSKSQGRVYFDCPPPHHPMQPGWVKPPSIYETDWEQRPELVARFQDSQVNRLLWDWGKVRNVNSLIEEKEKAEGELSMNDVIKFVVEN